MFAVFLLLLGYAVLPLSHYAGSGDPELRALVRFDPARGIRLLIPYFAASFGLLHSATEFFRRPFRIDPWRTAYFVAAAVLWGFTSPRLLTACVAGGALIYLLFMRRQGGIGLGTILVPLGLIVTVAFGATAFWYAYNVSRYDPSFAQRIMTFDVALNEWHRYPVFGVGQASNYSLNYQQMYGSQFYPADIGIVGILFEFGAVGVFAYAVLAALSVRAMFQIFGARVLNSSTEAAFALWTLCTFVGSLPSAGFSTLDGAPVTGALLGMGMICGEITRRRRLRNASTDRGRPIYAAI
jgi:hypothetical protein